VRLIPWAGGRVDDVSGDSRREKLEGYYRVEMNEAVGQDVTARHLPISGGRGSGKWGKNKELGEVKFLAGGTRMAEGRRTNNCARDAFLAGSTGKKRRKMDSEKNLPGVRPGVAQKQPTQ